VVVGARIGGLMRTTTAGEPWSAGHTKVKFDHICGKSLHYFLVFVQIQSHCGLAPCLWPCLLKPENLFKL